MRLAAISSGQVARARRLALCAVLLTATPAFAEPTSTPSPSPEPSPGPTFTSEAYTYTIQLPAGWAAVPADVTWDGQSQIDSNGLITDKITGPRGEFMFVFGAPTALSTTDFATQQQEWTAGWHGCPTVPDDARDAVLDGRPARVHAFICQGVQVFKLMAVDDGAGLVVNQIATPGNVDTLRSDFLARVEGISWRTMLQGDDVSLSPEASPTTP
jgi:hypothetical protein